jgi:hypothetical protein
MDGPPLQQIWGRPGLHVSPIAGVVSQKERRPHTSINYSLNSETLPLTPMEAMQFGRAPERYIRRIVHADPWFGPVKMIKVDLADSFYRVWVNAPYIIKLGVAFPNLEGEEPLIEFPIALPMGWTNSPPCFCGATKTIANISNERILKWNLHRLETLAATEPPPDLATFHPPPAPLIPSLPVTGTGVLGAETTRFKRSAGVGPSTHWPTYQKSRSDYLNRHVTHNQSRAFFVSTVRVSYLNLLKAIQWRLLPVTSLLG